MEVCENFVPEFRRKIGGGGCGFDWPRHLELWENVFEYWQRYQLGSVTLSKSKLFDRKI